MSELLLYGCRAQLVGEVAQRLCCRRGVVLCGRFYDSTFCLSTAGRGLGYRPVHRKRLGSCGVSPDRTLVFMLEPMVAHARATK